MSRILDYVLEPNVVYTNGAFLIKVKVQDDYKYKKYLVSESMKYTTATGTTFTLTNAVSTNNASILQLQGNTTQNGTPTPTSPIEVSTVSGDNEVEATGENLFNTEYYKTATYNTQNFYAYTPLKVRGGRYLLIKVALKSGGTAVSGAYLNISSGYGTPTSISSGQTITGISNGTALTRSFSFTENKLYLNIAGNIQDILNNYDIMLTTSNISYEPYTGNSYRVDLGGKNLFNYANTTITNSGITTTYNNGEISYSGTATTTYANLTDVTSLSLPVGTYTFSREGTNNVKITLRVWNTSNTRTDYNINANNNTVTFTISEKTDRTYLFLAGLTANTQYSGSIKVQLEKGSIATTYSPYVSNPIELCKIGNYVDSIKKSSGKNLCDIVLDSSVTGNIEYKTYFLEPNTQYIVSSNTWVSSTSTANVFVSSGTTFSPSSATNGVNGSRTVTSDSNGNITIGYRNVNNSMDYTDGQYFIMLNEGSTALPYEPYGNNWYIEKNIGKVVYNGTEADSFWAMNTGGGIRRFTQANGISNLYSNGDGVRYATLFINDHFKNSVNNEEGASFRYNNQIYFYYNTATSVSEWKTWLQSNNVTVYYVLSTPTYETITNENLIEQLNNIQDMQLIENLCYVDWVGTEKPKMTLQYPTNETLNAYITTEDNKLIRTDWRFIGRRK